MKERWWTYGEKRTIKPPLNIANKPRNPQKRRLRKQSRIRLDEVVNLVLADEMRDGVFVVCNAGGGGEGGPDVVG